MIRKPVVAGQFYPASKATLAEAIREYMPPSGNEKKVIGLAAPHAGYIYSGATAGKTYASAKIPKKVIILSPNHTGHGARAAIMSSGAWATPLGDVTVDSVLAEKLMSKCPLLTEDAIAHLGEHSLEVQLPFLISKEPKISIVPITIMHIGSAECTRIAHAIAETVKEASEDVVIVASTDMNHYERQDVTMKKDDLAIEKVVALDPEGLLGVCEENDVTMCGVIPTAIMLMAAKELGASTAELIEHTTSGDASGDYDSVVGYAGFLVY